MKGQFQSTESLRIRLTPFVSKVTGDYLTAGTDVCTLTIGKPDGSVYTGSPVTATWDAVTKMWLYTITTGSYAAGEWRVYAVSNDLNALPKWGVYFWGDYVDDITAAKLASQAAQSSSASAATDSAIIKKIQIGRWRINGTQLILYELNGTTEYMRFDLKDDLGAPSGTRVFERVPQ
jgi:hypothetical protein